MANAMANLFVKMSLQASGFTQGLRQQASELDSFAAKARATGAAMVSMGQKLTLGVTAPVIAFGTMAVDAASDLAEAQSAVSTVYGDAASQISGYSGSVARDLGLSRDQALSAAAQFGVFAESAGLSGTAMADFSNESLQAAADLASFYNAPVPEALAAIKSGLTGEVEPLRRFGVLLSDANIQQYALANGIWDGTGAMTEQQKVLARQGFIMASLGAAQGDFARTSGGLANSTRIARAQFRDMAATLGQLVLPYVTQGVAGLQRLFTWVSSLSPAMRKWVVILGLVAAALGPLLVVLGTVVSAMASLGPVLGVIAGPIGLLVLALVAFGIAYQTNFLGFADAVNWVARVVGGPFVTRIWKALKKIIGGFQDLFEAIEQGDLAGVFTALRKMLAGVGDALSAPAKAIGDFFKNIQTGFAPLDRLLHTIGALWTDFGRLIQEVFQGDWAGALEVGRRLLRHFWEAVQQGVGLIVAVLRNIPWADLWAGLKAAAAAALAGLADLAVMALSGLVTLFQAIDWGAVGAAILSGLQTALVTVGGWIAGLAGWLAGYVPSWGDLAAALGSIAGAISGLVDTYLIPGFQAVLDWFGGLVAAVVGVVPTSWADVTSALGTLAGVFDGPLGLLQTAWGKILGIFIVIKTAIVAALPGSWDDVVGLLAPLGTVFDAARTALTLGWNAVLAIFAVVRGAIAAALPGNWTWLDALLAGLGVVLNAPLSALQAAWGGLLALFSVIKSAITAALPPNWAWLETLLAGLGSVLDAPGQALTTAWGTIAGIFSGAEQAIRDVLPADWGFVQSAFEGLGNAVQTAYDHTIGPAVDLVKEALDLVGLGGGGGEAPSATSGGTVVGFGGGAAEAGAGAGGSIGLTPEQAAARAAEVRAAIANQFIGLRSDLTTIMDGVRRAIQNPLTMMPAVVASKASESREGIANEFVGLRGDVETILRSIQSAIFTSMGTWNSQSRARAAALRADVANQFVGLRGDVASILASATATVANAFVGMRDQAVSIAGALRAGVANAFVGLRGDVAAIMSGVAGAVLGTLWGLRGSAGGAGAAVGDAIGAGLYNSMAGWIGPVAAMAASLVNAAESSARSAVDAHSDSRVWMALADDMVGGLVRRLEAGQRQVAAAVGALPLVPAAPALAGLGAAAGAGGRAVMLSVSMPINAPIYGVDDLERTVVGVFEGQVAPRLLDALAEQDRAVGVRP